MAPHVIIQSTLNYFKSKGPGLNRLSIIAEDEERTRLNDARLIMLRQPRQRPNGINIILFLKRLFPRHRYVEEQRYTIKICYTRRAKCVKDLDEFYKSKPHWPNGERIEMMRLNSRIGRDMEIIYQELVIRNVHAETNIRLNFEVGTKFPNKSDFRQDQQKLIIYFDTIQAAFEAYKKGKEIEFCGHKISVVYNKKRRQFDTDYIRKEEKSRLEDNENRVLFLEFPASKLSFKQMEKDVNYYFKRNGSINFMGSMIKVCYKQNWEKVQDLTDFHNHRREPYWSDKAPIRIKEIACNFRCLDGVIIETELILRNLIIHESKETMDKAIKKAFPSMIEHWTNHGSIVVRFQDRFDALEAFKNGKKVEICQCVTNVFFNRSDSRRYFGGRDRSRSPARRR